MAMRLIRRKRSGAPSRRPCRTPEVPRRVLAEAAKKRGAADEDDGRRVGTERRLLEPHERLRVNRVEEPRARQEGRHRGPAQRPDDGAPPITKPKYVDVVA